MTDPESSIVWWIWEAQNISLLSVNWGVSQLSHKTHLHEFVNVIQEVRIEVNKATGRIFQFPYLVFRIVIHVFQFSHLGPWLAKKKLEFATFTLNIKVKRLKLQTYLDRFDVEFAIKRCPRVRWCDISPSVTSLALVAENITRLGLFSPRSAFEIIKTTENCILINFIVCKSTFSSRNFPVLNFKAYSVRRDKGP